jgi:Protein of unknown function (DUF669)
VTASLSQAIRDRILACIRLAKSPGTAGEGDAAVFAVGRLVVAHADAITVALTGGGQSRPEPKPRPEPKREPQDVGPLAAGDYVFEIVHSDIRENSKGTGEYLLLVLHGLEGAAKGCVVFDYLNFKNPNAWAVQEAHKRLAQIADALGIGDLKDSEELHYQPLRIRLRVRDGRNEVVRYGRV